MLILQILGALFGLILLIILFLIVCALLVRPRDYEKESRFYRWLLNVCSVAGLWLLGVRTTVSGVEKLPADRRFLLVCNHRSNYDPIITWATLRRFRFAFISKPSNFKIPVFGRYIRKCRFMAIDRENPRKALPTINRAASLLDSGESAVAVYPEGTRSKNRRLLPFHPSVFKIAHRGNGGVAIAAISGTENIFRNIKRLRRTRVKLEIIAFLPAEQVKKMSTAQLSDFARNLIDKALSK